MAALIPPPPSERVWSAHYKLFYSPNKLYWFTLSQGHILIDFVFNLAQHPCFWDLTGFSAQELPKAVYSIFFRVRPKFYVLDQQDEHWISFISFRNLHNDYRN